MSPGVLSTFEDRYANARSFVGTHISGYENAMPPGWEARLKKASYNETHDLICVGFGPAALAIAVALNDHLDSFRYTNNANAIPSIRFLERQTQFGWHAGMLLPGAKMQISFIKDLATIRNPCSHFTFLNYLKHRNRLVQFSNLGTFLPSRVEFEDYLRWAANHFTHVVDYGQEALLIRPACTRQGEKVGCWEVHSQDAKTGIVSTYFSKNVVIAVGGKPAVPDLYLNHNDFVLHSSQYSTRIGRMLPHTKLPYKIVVVGAGQSAAELFHDLHSRYPNASTKLIIRDTALRPSDDSPFVNEVFNPEAVDTFFCQTEELRQHSLKTNKATNYSVVRMELLEKIYEEQYMQSVQQRDPKLWQHQILASKEIVQFVNSPHDGQVRLVLRDLGSLSPREESIDADVVILATGYHRNAHVELLKECEHLNSSADGKWTVNRDYGLQLDRSLVQSDASIWLQGCNEETHGLSDSLLSILATRSGELVQSILQDCDH